MPFLPEGLTLTERAGPLETMNADAVSALRLKTWKARTERILKAEDEWVEELDNTARHFFVKNAAELVAAARLHIFQDWKEIGYAEWFNQLSITPKPPVAFLSRLVVDPGYQRKGIGSCLDTVRLARARELGASSAFCDVPPYRVEHMRKLGFRVAQPPKKGFILPDIEWTAIYMEF